MRCYWHNGALCLEAETDEEDKALIVMGRAWRAGLKPSATAGLRGQSYAWGEGVDVDDAGVGRHDESIVSISVKEGA